MAIASSIVFGFTQILVRQGIQNASPVSAALIMNSMVSMGGLLIAISSGTLMNSTLPPILWYLAIGITGPGIARVMYYIGISRMGVSRTSGISSATPIWGVIFATIFLGESPNTLIILGTLSIVFGVGVLSIQDDDSKSFKDWFQTAIFFCIDCIYCLCNTTDSRKVCLQISVNTCGWNVFLLCNGKYSSVFLEKGFT